MNADPNLWLEDTSRQDNWEAHRKTESIVLKIGKNLQSVSFTKAWDSKWKKILLPTVVKFLEDKFGEGQITRMIISKLYAGAEIGEHRDTEHLLCYSHRVHLPIYTDSAVDFVIGGESFFLKEGVFYEISNQDLHMVKNQSKIDRIHIIADYADTKLLDLMQYGF
jgi:hypothetical protein